MKIAKSILLGASLLLISPHVDPALPLTQSQALRSTEGSSRILWQSAVRVAAKFPTIQAAHDDLPSSGGTIFVPAGFYGHLVISKSNVHVIGEGAGSVLRAQNAADNTITVTAGLSNVTIESLKIVGGGKRLIEQPIDEGRYFEGNGIYAGSQTSRAAISNLVVKNCTFANSFGDVYFQYVNHGEVSGNHFSGDLDGLAQVTLDRSDGVRVEKNTGTSSAGMANGVYVLSRAPDANATSDHHVIAGNTFRGNYRYEVMNVFGGFNTITANTIEITGATAHSTGIVIGQNNMSPRVTARGNVVHGNTVSLAGSGGSTGSFAISVNNQRCGYSPEDNVIANNVVTMGLEGATLAVGITSATRTRLVRNDITVKSGASVDGVLVMDDNISGHDNEVIANTITGASGNGIDLICQRSKIVGNTVQSGTNVHGAGLFIPRGNSAHGTSISGNLFYNNAGRAISVRSSSGADIIIEGNIELSNGLKDVDRTK